MEIKTTTIEGKPRKIKARWTIEEDSKYHESIEELIRKKEAEDAYNRAMKGVM